MVSYIEIRRREVADALAHKSKMDEGYALACLREKEVRSQRAEVMDAYYTEMSTLEGRVFPIDPAALRGQTEIADGTMQGLFKNTELLQAVLALYKRYSALNKELDAAAEAVLSARDRAEDAERTHVRMKNLLSVLDEEAA